MSLDLPDIFFLQDITELVSLLMQVSQIKGKRQGYNCQSEAESFGHTYNISCAPQNRAVRGIWSKFSTKKKKEKTRTVRSVTCDYNNNE